MKALLLRLSRRLSPVTEDEVVAFLSKAAETIPPLSPNDRREVSLACKTGWHSQSADFSHQYEPEVEWTALHNNLGAACMETSKVSLSNALEKLAVKGLK